MRPGGIGSKDAPMQTIALIDYGSGNIHSAARALRAGADLAGVSCQIELTDQPERVARADRIVLPGVGHFADCMAALQARDGLIEALEADVIGRGKPFLGICVGMQLMADLGLEDGETPGLGWISGCVRPIAPEGGLAVPHMGWNEIKAQTDHPILRGLADQSHVYFVHSYAFDSASDSAVAATTAYGQTITAAVAKDNLFGTQFHPEKSQKAGLQLLANFVNWTL